MKSCISSTWFLTLIGFVAYSWVKFLVLNKIWFFQYLTIVTLISKLHNRNKRLEKVYCKNYFLWFYDAYKQMHIKLKIVYAYHCLILETIWVVTPRMARQTAKILKCKHIFDFRRIYVHLKISFYIFKDNNNNQGDWVFMAVKWFFMTYECKKKCC